MFNKIIKRIPHICLAFIFSLTGISHADDISTPIYWDVDQKIKECTKIAGKKYCSPKVKIKGKAGIKKILYTADTPTGFVIHYDLSQPVKSSYNISFGISDGEKCQTLAGAGAIFDISLCGQLDGLDVDADKGLYIERFKSRAIAKYGKIKVGGIKISGGGKKTENLANVLIDQWVK